MGVATLLYLTFHPQIDPPDIFFFPFLFYFTRKLLNEKVG